MDRFLAAWLLLLGPIAGCNGQIGDSDEPTGGTPLETGDPNDPNDPMGPEVPPELQELVGTSPLRRLTQVEYRNTVEAAFDVTLPSSIALPPDQELSGYTTQSTDLLNDQSLSLYLDAAMESAGLIAGAADGCTSDCLDDWLQRAVPVLFRRPLEEADADELRATYEDALAVEGTTPEEAFDVFLTRLLIAPEFLYKVERRRDGDVASGAFVLSDYELASRLSYFLTSRPPDAELRDAAAAGLLDNQSLLLTQAERLLESDEGRATIATFHDQWLHLGRIESIQHPESEFPGYTPSLVEQMREETARFTTETVLDRDGTFETLLTADFSYVTDELAAFYGMNAPQAPFQRTPYPSGSRRSGIFGHGSFLAAHSKELESSVIFRGLVVREQLLCGVLLEPPDGATDMDVEDRLQHTVCRSCHQRIDPIGRAFEEFDAVGRHRAGRDTAASIVLSESSDGDFAGAPELAAHLAQSPEVHSCYARQWLRFAMGRPEGPLDIASLNAIGDAFSTELSIRQLLMAFVGSEAFRTRYQPEQPTCEETP